MELWNDFLGWFESADGERMMGNVIIPFVAILVAGVVAALIGRGSTKRLITLNDRENRVSAVATMIGAARRASVWNTLSVPEQQHADHVASEADVRVRLLAVPGSSLAADWAAHEIASMKRDSVSFSFQAEQSLIEFRDRMVTWQGKPGRAKKLFKNDLDLWAYEDSKNKNDIVAQQQAWAAAQVASETGPVSTMKPSQKEAEAAQPRAVAAAAPAPARAPDPTPEPTPAPISVSATATEPQPETVGSTEETPELIEPARRSNGNADDGNGNRLDEALHSSVTANTVAQRINPPRVGDDGQNH
ncbi:hypothetical protein [Marisediminicola antarctica]|uniref:Uncharacterized protein n=1 Tax=Marisediminicola antarctica TaxID=674079 RepID=A0A7L5AQB0_9MICO|nr:hypothetical protein [Marisediminicola antarctica]QHO70559.1 hypothetical protein BHD05_13770 [Marisediminicola antarctica]